MTQRQDFSLLPHISWSFVSFLKSPVPCLLESSVYAKIGWEDMEELDSPDKRHPNRIPSPFWVGVERVTRAQLLSSWH